jgi:hypothetical protein
LVSLVFLYRCCFACVEIYAFFIGFSVELLGLFFASKDFGVLDLCARTNLVMSSTVAQAKTNSMDKHEFANKKYEEMKLKNMEILKRFEVGDF